MDHVVDLGEFLLVRADLFDSSIWSYASSFDRREALNETDALQAPEAAVWVESGFAAARANVRFRRKGDTPLEDIPDIFT